MKKIAAAAMVVSALALAACERKPAEEQAAQPQAETTATPAQESAAVAPAQDPFLADNLKNPGWGQTATGLQFKTPDERATEGASQPTASSTVTVHYEGKLTNGTVFDSSKGGEPITFPLSNVIPGWQEAVPMMRVGETWNFAIPANLAYGDRPVGPIPPGSTLLFEIQLLKIE
ncbi:MAG: FKBP-type peptidyl-prolyl cis-trans isomerase [Rhodospirillaceae bacterium]